MLHQFAGRQRLSGKVQSVMHYIKGVWSGTLYQPAITLSGDGGASKGCSPAA
jgi:hypothetical protein